MCSRKKLSILGAIAILASAISVQSAEIVPEPPVVELPPAEKFGGWYLRGDIGYASIDVENVTYFQGPTQTGRFVTREIDDTWSFGGGIGYQINDWFRVDWTANYYAEADFIGSSAIGVPCSDGTPGAICSYSDNGSFEATTLMANAYLDLGHYSGFTPYIGAGIGGAYVTWGSINNVESPTSGPPPAVLANDTHAGRSGWRFAYGLYAGASYELTSKLMIDAGYSYINIGEGEMFGFGATSGFVGTQGYHSNLNIHAFKVGLRYQIW